MQGMMAQVLTRAGRLLSHRQRRFILDRLGVGGIINRLAENQFDEVLLPNGVRLVINSLLHGYLAQSGRLSYEPEVVEFLEEHLGSGDVFFDVGANVGVFSFLAATKVGPAGQVHAFEPEENNVACFRQTLEQTGFANVTLYDCALGAKAGIMSFDRRGGAFSGRLTDGVAGNIGSTVEVDVRTVDDLVDNGASAPSLMKIDVEGGEGAVLEGARRVLHAARPMVLCEMHGFDRDGMGRAFAALDAAGYQCRALDGSPMDAERRVGDHSYHVVAVPT